MSTETLTGAAALALASVLTTAGPASARTWQGDCGNVIVEAGGLAAADVVGGPPATETSPSWAMGYYYNGYYPGYAYVPGYSFAPLYGSYSVYNWGPWSYRGGLHPR